MKKVIIFDLYDTVLKDISFSFKKGITELYQKFFSEKCSLEEFMEFEETFYPLYSQRKVDNSEVCLIQDEIPSFYEKFGVPKPKSWEELDYDIMNRMQKDVLLDEVRDTLKSLQMQGIDMYILSNSIFTGTSTRRLLDDFGILHYFKKVYSSADYKTRKPGTRFYEIAIDEVLASHPGMTKENILYVGNDYVTDVKGAISAGLDVVWYNVNHLQNQEGLDILEIDDFRQLINILL